MKWALICGLTMFIGAGEIQRYYGMTPTLTFAFGVAVGTALMCWMFWDMTR